jgi:hypothetical protein
MKMNKLALSIAIAVAVPVSVQATTFDVSGHFEAGTAANLELSIGSPQSLFLAGSYLDISGQVINDGATITGGTITITGQQYMNPTGTPITIDMNMSGTATSSGVLFTSGSLCFTAILACDEGDIDISVDNFSFLDGESWGYNTGLGLQLGDGTEAADYAAAQNGSIADLGNHLGGAAGAGTLLGNSFGIFMSGDLTMANVPVPAAAWLFGSALIGLAGIKRKK